MPIFVILAIIALGAGALAALTVATFVVGSLLSVVAGFAVLGTAAQYTGSNSVMLLFGVLAALVLFLGVRVMMKVVQGETPLTPLQKPDVPDVHGTAPHSASLSTAASSGTSGTPGHLSIIRGHLSIKPAG